LYKPVYVHPQYPAIAALSRSAAIAAGFGFGRGFMEGLVILIPRHVNYPPSLDIPPD
jgi:hypothetical protein